MRSFRPYVGHRSRLTAAGWALLLLSAATTASLGLAGGIWGVFRLGPATAVIYPYLVAGFGVAVWSAGAGLCRLAGIPLINPGSQGWGGTPSVPRERSRRPLQFPLVRLQWVILSVAVLCALARLDSDQIGKVMYLVGMLTVITVGTAGIVVRRGPTGLRGGMARGGLAGSCLSAVCLGWMFVLLWVIKPGIGPLLALGSVTMLGGLLGGLIGLATVVWQRKHSGGRCKAFIHRPHGS
jgi:hypothetical protein